jgi:hypothetical protein
MKYNIIDNYYFGFTDLTISEIGRYCPCFINNMSMLITCLDSTSSVINLSRWVQILEKRKFVFERFDDSLWFPVGETLRIFKEGFTFNGFDEVYFFKDKPLAESVTSVFSSAVFDFSENVPNDFVEGFRAIGATRYLSDGCGLNFVCESEQLLSSIEMIAKRFKEG